MRDNRCICLQGTLPGAPFTPQPDCLLHGHRHPSRMPHAPAAEPPELAAIRERVERDFVTDPASVSGVLSAELMQARIDRRALLVNFDAELSEHAKAAPEMPRPPAEEALGAVEPSGTGSGRGTGVLEAENSDQESEWPDMDGWTLTASPRGVMVSHSTDADMRALVADQGDPLPVGAVLAFIADQQPEEDDEAPDLSLIPADLIKSDPGIRGGEPCITGTRIPASEVASYLADGATWDEIREMLPSLPSLPAPSTEEDRDG